MILIYLFAQKCLSVGILHGSVVITGLSPNISTRRFNLENTFPVYLQSMYNDQPDLEIRKFKLPVKVHVHRKQHEDGTWRMQNYVEFPFPVYYDHMRVIKMSDPKCQPIKDEPQNEQNGPNQQQVDDGFSTSEDTKKYEKMGYEFRTKTDKYLEEELGTVNKRTQKILQRMRNSPEEHQHLCKDILAPEGFVFIFDNPDSENMMKVRTRKEPEHVIPRHDLFYHLTGGLQLYFHTNENNDLVDRFDDGDMVGNQFSAIIHSLDFPKHGLFKADFFIHNVDRLDPTHDEELQILGEQEDDDFDQIGFEQDEYSDNSLLQQFNRFKKSYSASQRKDMTKDLSGHEGYLMFKEFQEEEHIKGKFLINYYHFSFWLL